MVNFWRVVVGVVVMTAGGVALSGPVAAAHHVRLERVHHVLPVTDGARLSAWLTHGKVTVLRDTDRRDSGSTVSFATDCFLDDFFGVRSDAIATVCGGSAVKPMHSVLYDLATARVTAVPGGSALADYMLSHDANGEFFYVDAVGRRLLQFHGSSSHDDFSFLQDLLTGRVFDSPRLGPHQIVDLDRADAVGALCRPLAVTTHRSDIDPGARERDPATYTAPYLATLSRGTARLGRCGRHARVTLGRSRIAPVLTSRYVAWATATRLRVLMLRSRRRLTFVLREPSNGIIEPTITATNHRLWLHYGHTVRVLEL